MGDNINKVLVALAGAAIIAAASAVVKLERLEAKFEALDLEDLPALVQDNHKTLAVHTQQLNSIDDKMDDLKEMLRDSPR